MPFQIHLSVPDRPTHDVARGATCVLRVNCFRLIRIKFV